MQILDLFRREVGGNFFKDSLLVVIELVWPRVLACYFGLAVIVDEDICWLHIAYLLSSCVQCPSRIHQTQSQVPKLLVLEGFAWLGRTVADLIAKQEWVIIEFDLSSMIDTLHMPLAPQSCVLWNSKLRGRRRTSYDSSPLKPFYQLATSPSLITATEIWML